MTAGTSDPEGLIVDPALQAKENQQVNLALSPLPPPVITGMKLNGDVRLTPSLTQDEERNELVFNTIDENNVLWVITDIEGWWTHPEPDIQDIRRGFGDGSYSVRGRWSARDITLKGVFYPPDPSYVRASRDKLVLATSLVYESSYLVVNEDPVKASLVRLSGRPEIETVNARGKTEFSIGLRAPDPIKYSWAEDDPGGYSYAENFAKNIALGRDGKFTVNNLGTARVTCIFEITGPLVGPAVLFNETTDELIVIIESLDATDILEIDTYDHEVALNGDTAGARAMIDVLADWIRLDPGENILSFYDEGAVNGQAKLSVYYKSGWLG